MGAVFERFTERARQVVVLAQSEVRERDDIYIGCEHILLGLLLEAEGLAAKVLTHLGVTPDGVREGIDKRVKRGEFPGDKGSPKTPSFTPRAQKALELALREALSLGHNYIGTEHVLLGLLREQDNVALRILREDFSLDDDVVRSEVIRMLSGPSAPVLKKKPHVVDQAKLDEKAQTARDRLEELKHNTEQVFSRSTAIDLMVEAIEQARKHPHRNPEKIARGILVMRDKD